MRVVCLSLFVAVALGDTLRFLTLGDWGGSAQPPYTTTVQLEVAAAIQGWKKTFQPQFLFAIGDNFYEDGISCLNDPAKNCTTDVTSHRFLDTWQNVYTPIDIPWYVLAGNHDHHATSNASAEIAFSAKNSLWIYPDFWYTFTKKFVDDSGKTVSVQFLMIDTVITGNSSDPASQQQLAWIESTMKASTADWLIVNGHYPVWSIAEHGPTSELIKDLQPLLVKYGAALYICGHDHNLQYLDDGTVTGYLLTGSGHSEDSSNEHASNVPAGSSKFFSSIGGFGSVTIHDVNTVSVDIVDKNQKIVYSFKRTNPRPVATS